jgi:hypothetical protein
MHVSPHPPQAARFCECLQSPIFSNPLQYFVTASGVLHLLFFCLFHTVECRTRFLCASFRADEPVELTVSLLSTAPLPLNLTKMCVLFFQEVKNYWWNMINIHMYMYSIPYSRKYWRELNLAVEPKIAIARILADLNLAVRYGIAIRIYASRKFWQILIWRL